MLRHGKKLLAIGCFCIGTNQVDLEVRTVLTVIVDTLPLLKICIWCTMPHNHLKALILMYMARFASRYLCGNGALMANADHNAADTHRKVLLLSPKPRNLLLPEQAANKRGVPVFNAPFSNTRSVAELVIGEVIALARQLAQRAAEMHAGTWRKVSHGCWEVRGKALGIVGYGHIGSQVRACCAARAVQSSLPPERMHLLCACNALSECPFACFVKCLVLRGRQACACMRSR